MRKFSSPEERVELIENLFGDYPKHVLERFRKWHEANPQVWRIFKKKAREMKATGMKTYSARTIIEVVRWHFDIKTKGNPFKINNDFSPLYGRLMIFNYPEFEGFFELREVKSIGVFSGEERDRDKGEFLH